MKDTSMDKKVQIRINEADHLILSEIADLGKSNISTVIRALVRYGLDQLIDESGNLKPEYKDGFRN